jgi:hypothetical protein
MMFVLQGGNAMQKFTRAVSLGFLFGLVLFLALTIQIQAGPEPPYTPVEPPLLSMGQEQTIQAVAAPATYGSPAPDSPAAPCVGGTCPATIVSCNSVVNWKNDDTNQWDTYGCLDTTIFPTVRYSETFYSITIVSDSIDLALAIPFARVPPGQIMDHFGAILNTCDSNDCRSATHVKARTIYQHAIVSNAQKQSYILAIDSPNMNAEGDAIISCGSHDTGWCKDPGVISTTFQCGNFSFHDNANNGLDNITYYGTNYAFDGKEMTYKLVLTESRYVSVTLHYSGNPAQDYNNYMELFVLREACNQQEPFGYTGLAGETGATSSTVSGWFPAGTYYLVADGTHMPYGGDPFQVDMGCSDLEASKKFVYLPIVLKNH